MYVQDRNTDRGVTIKKTTEKLFSNVLLIRLVHLPSCKCPFLLAPDARTDYRDRLGASNAPSGAEPDTESTKLGSIGSLERMTFHVLTWGVWCHACPLWQPAQQSGSDSTRHHACAQRWDGAQDHSARGSQSTAWKASSCLTLALTAH